MNLSTLSHPTSNSGIRDQFLRRCRTYRSTGDTNPCQGAYKQNGKTTTPLDLTVVDDLRRLCLVDAVIDRVPGFGNRAAYAKQFVRDKLIVHRHYIFEHGQDMPEVRNWEWRAERRRTRK